LEGGPEEAPKPGSDAVTPSGTSGTGFSRDVQVRVLLAQRREWRALDKLVEDALAPLDPGWCSGREYRNKESKTVPVLETARLEIAERRVAVFDQMCGALAKKQPREREAYGIDLSTFGGVDQGAAEQQAKAAAASKRILDMVRAIKQGAMIQEQTMEATG
ncbi:MAG: hypothetical protein M3158_01590, partial [Pseudomonadota bacterium]|nr:hypothetical protein [Pseudomonadota bacterium]